MNTLQIKTLILGLILLLSGHSLFAFKFITSDGEREITGKDLEIMKSSKTIKDFIDDVGGDEIPLPNISSATLDLLLRLMRSADDAALLQPFDQNNPARLEQRDHVAQWLTNAQLMLKTLISIGQDVELNDLLRLLQAA